jgi:hypothetical protein
MAKRGNGTNYTSKGERPNVKKSTLKAMRRTTSYLDKHENKMRAFAKGRKVMLTIPNPNKNETNKRFIRVEAKDYLLDPRRGFMIK